MVKSTLYEQLRTHENLHSAWRAIQKNGTVSQCRHTRDEVAEFGKNPFRHFKRIRDQLRQERYEFTPARGVLVKRNGKRPRPLVLACVQDRVVQRAILQMLRKHEPVGRQIDVRTSFGTSQRQSIANAMELVQERLRSETKYVIRSDIKDFFTKVPRTEVLAELEPLFNDPPFFRILNEATHVELENYGALGSFAETFPGEHTGVAQGCSLSPLLGNVFLREFDDITNAKGVTCLRYVDDFLILAPSQRLAHQCFRIAERWLNAHGLEVHPLGSAKCYEGPADRMFEFLGCSVQPGLVGPSRSKRQELRENVRAILHRALLPAREPTGEIDAKSTVARILYDVGNLTAAWAAAYRFCNDLKTLRDLESQIDQDVIEYLRKRLAGLRGQLPRKQCEGLGVRSICGIVASGQAQAAANTRSRCVPTDGNGNVSGMS